MSINKFLLNKLERCDWTAELLALESILACANKAVFKGTYDTPSNTVTIEWSLGSGA